MRVKRVSKSVIVFVSLIVAVTFICLLSVTRLTSIGNVNPNSITKIEFVDGRGGLNKPFTLEDGDKIKEFMAYMDKCIVLRDFTTPDAVGWSQMIDFYSNNKKVLSIVISKPIKINGKSYSIIKGNSLDYIDKFVQSCNSSWVTP